MFVRVMSREECQGVVAAGDLARLACCRDDQPYIVPITYAHSGNRLYCFSMPGQKIDWMRSNPKVSLQIAEFASNRQWKSVVVTGRYQELPATQGCHHERIHAWSLREKKAKLVEARRSQACSKAICPYLRLRCDGRDSGPGSKRCCSRRTARRACIKTATCPGDRSR